MNRFALLIPLLLMFHGDTSAKESQPMNLRAAIISRGISVDGRNLKNGKLRLFQFPNSMKGN
jgi:hypothetical protein